MSDKPAILVVQPLLSPIAAMLEPDFTVWRLWQGPPLEASHTIGALVVAGEYPIDFALVESLPNVGLIACFSAGYDGIDLAWANERGLKVSHSPGVNHEDVADLAIALMLAAWRGLLEGHAIVREGRWRPTERRITPSLAGKHLGIVGLGAIGEAVARRAETFGLKIAWWGPNQKPDVRWPQAESLVALAEASDILIVAARASEANRGLVDRVVIEALGPNGLLVNVARGQLVDEDALIAALKNERLGMAALDVFAAEPTPAERWADVPNVVLSPHTGGATSAALPKMMALTRENLRRFFAGEPLANAVVE
jgi:lactate dehydrogenase-like 2-hydroxyacid dehydrogenase